MSLIEPRRLLHKPRTRFAKLRVWSCAIIVLCGVLCVLCGAKTGLGQETAAQLYIPGEILVKFKPGVQDERIRRWHASLGVIQRGQVGPAHIQRLGLPVGLSVDAAVAVYRQNPDVDYAEPNYLRKAFAFPLDPAITRQWALYNTDQALIGTDPPIGGNDGVQMTIGADIDAPDAWDITTGDVLAPARFVSGAGTGLSNPAGVYVDTVNNEIGVVNRTNNSVTIYPRTANGDVAPLRTVSGAGTGLSGPAGLYVDTVNNEIGVVNRTNNSVTIYPRTANGDVAPLRTLTGPSTGLNSPAGVYVDTVNNEIGVVNRTSDTVTIYSRTANGDVAPLRAVSGAGTGLSSPVGLYVDTVDNEIGVVNSTNNSVTIYPRTADGDVAPLRTVSGAGTGLSSPAGVYVDRVNTVNNTIGVVNRSANSVTIYPRTADGDVAPVSTVSGVSTGLSNPAGVYVDTVNNEIGVVNSTSNSVTVYSHMGDWPQTVIAVIDSGVDYTHPDLSTNIWNNPGEDAWADLQHQNPAYGNGFDDDLNGYIDDWKGWNFVGSQQCSIDAQGNCNCPMIDPDYQGDNDPMDDFGHGTPVSGVVAAIGNNAMGIAGVMWRAKIMPLKVLDAVGCGNIDREVNAINYAVDNGARVIVLSSGGAGYSQSEFDAIQAANHAGVLVVTAAGNDSSNNNHVPVYPSNYGLPNMISVAASDFKDQLAFFSNFGPTTVDLAAPGDCIFSTMPTGSFTLQTEVNTTCTTSNFTQNYDYVGGSYGNTYTGTSFAAAHVAGVAGLLLSLNSDLKPSRLKTVLMTTVDPEPGLVNKVVAGGRLNADRALTNKTGSTLANGTGGDAGCFGIAFHLGRDRGGPDPPSPGTAAATMLSMTLPLLLASRRLRNLLLRFRRSQMGVPTLLMSAVILHLLATAAYSQEQEAPKEATDHASKLFPHQLSLKLGLHRYPDSGYFDSNSAYFNKNDLSSIAAELEYDYLWLYPDYPNSSLGLAVGYYDGQTGLQTVCCSQVAFSTLYTLLTLKYKYSPARLAPLYIYGGGGVGYYIFYRDVTQTGVNSHFSEQVFGTHYLAGVGWPLTQNLSFFTEVRYAFAKIKSADALDDSLSIGGWTTFMGLAWQFPNFAHLIPSKPPPVQPAVQQEKAAEPPAPESQAPQEPKQEPQEPKQESQESK
jgi:subtilisin family serine protease/6-phosphogluconolactonase (cycloisomerase 2 family)